MATQCYFVVSPDPRSYVIDEQGQQPQYGIKFGDQTDDLTRINAYRTCNPSFVWIDIAIDNYNNPHNTRFGNYMQANVIINYINRSGTARNFAQVPNTNEWYISNNARMDLQFLLTAASSVDNAQDAMKLIVQSYAGSIGYRLRDNNQPVQALPFAIQNPKTGTSAEIRRLVTRVLGTNNQALSPALQQNLALATDLNWIFNNVWDVLRHHTTAYLLCFCDESAARLFFNFLVQTT
ncbi:hypothetical protein CKAH01_06477 [Colletotrichum kahawae]|uniref:Uncharacterized protein n=1 Tax=Colletotrichum kahawae TaxID=34407 RepID=A0AAE0D3X5_COLKA|nr:hypothetical protein CKAH01_06477 [Colletotrichum kahawae]